MTLSESKPETTHTSQSEHCNSHFIVIMILIPTVNSIEADIPMLQADSYSISTVHYSNIQVGITGSIDTVAQTFVKDIFEQYLCTVIGCPSHWFAGILPVLLQYDEAAQTLLSNCTFCSCEQRC